MSFNNEEGITIFGPSIQQKENGRFEKKYIMNSKFINDNIDLIIWDFDNTLIDTRAYLLHSMEPDYIREKLTDEQLKWDFPHWEFFRDVVIDLVNKGKYVGIASFGMYNIIRAYMDRIFGVNQKYFTVVNTFARCKIDEPLQQNKNGYMLNIMEHYRITNSDRVLLFDDLSSNIAAAIQLGFVAILVEGVKYHNGQRVCGGLFGPKQLAGMEKQLRNILNNPNPLHIAQLGHVGDRKVAIEMYGRRDRSPMNMKKYIYPDSLYIQHQTEPTNINLYDTNFNGILDTNETNTTLLNKLKSSVKYSEPQFKKPLKYNHQSYNTITESHNANCTNNNIDNTYNMLIKKNCENCEGLTPIFIIIGVILVIAIILFIMYIM